MEYIDLISSCISYVMLGVLGVFVLLGIIFGFARGLKRSVLRMVILISLLVISFFLTPVIVGSLLGVDTSIAGQTPVQWYNGVSEEIVNALSDAGGNYMIPFLSYMQEYSLGFVLAFVNIAFFFVMYIVVKIVSWVIYAIIAHFMAPKRDQDGKKLPKHAVGGLLVGALQGVLLFAFFMLPINGMIGVINRASQYEMAESSSITTAAESSSTDEMKQSFRKLDSSLNLYNQIMNYTGLQFLTDKAFHYQMTVDFDDESVDLVHDINTAWELYIDYAKLEPVVKKINNISDVNGLSKLTAGDYQILRRYINKVFDLQIIHIADGIIADLDQILNTQFTDNDALLEGTNIYVDSFYGLIVKNFVSNRDDLTIKDKNAGLTSGLRALVGFIGEQKINLIRDDILTEIDLMETLTTYQVKFGSDVTTVAGILAKSNLNWVDYLDLMTSRLEKKYDSYDVDTPIMSVLGNEFKQLSLIKMMGLNDVEKIVTYSSMLDNVLNDQQDTKKLIMDMSELLLGEKAFNKDGQQGTWEKLGNTILDVAELVRNNSDLIDEITQIMSQDDKDMTALIECISKLTIDEAYFNAHRDDFGAAEYNNDVKYQRVKQLTDVAYDIINAFEPVKDYVQSYVANLASENELFNTLDEMLSGNKDKWFSTIRGLVSAANLANNDAVKELLNKIEDNEQSEITTDDLVQILDVAVNEMDAEDVVELIDTMLNLPEVGDVAKDAINEVLDAEFDWSTILESDSESVTAVETSLETLKNYLDDSDESPEVSSEEMKDAIETLWKTLQGSEAFEEYLKTLANTGNQD